MQCNMANKLGMPVRELQKPGRLKGGLLKPLARLAGDPDVKAAEWVIDTAPLGVLRPIAPWGSVPHCAGR